jgi:hypothetical protein
MNEQGITISISLESQSYLWLADYNFRGTNNEGNLYTIRKKKELAQNKLCFVQVTKKIIKLKSYTASLELFFRGELKTRLKDSASER